MRPTMTDSVIQAPLVQSIREMLQALGTQMLQWESQVGNRRHESVPGTQADSLRTRDSVGRGTQWTCVIVCLYAVLL